MKTERKENRKKLVAVLAAVSAYIKTEEEARLSMPAPAAISSQAAAPANFWGMSGRQAMMQNRNLMQMKTFHRTGLR